MASTQEMSPTPGDSDIIRDLYPQLRRFAAVVGPSEIDPDDLVQEALVSTIQRQPLGTLEHPSSDLWKVMRNLATDHRRRMGRRRTALSRIGPPEPQYPSYPSDLDDLDQLTPKARAVLYLREIDGYGCAEIVEMLDVREASLRRTARRARQSLRKSFYEEDHDAASS